MLAPIRLESDEGAVEERVGASVTLEDALLLLLLLVVVVVV